MMNLCQLSFDRIQGREIVLERNDLPIVSICLLTDFRLGFLHLELSDLLPHTGEFVSVNDFHSGKQGLYGSNTTKNTSIDHRNGQIQTSHLRNRHLKIGLYQSILCQKSTARGGNLREIVCKGLTPSLAGCLQIETAVLQRTIVHCSGLTTLFERKSLRLYREGG